MSANVLTGYDICDAMICVIYRALGGAAVPLLKHVQEWAEIDFASSCSSVQLLLWKIRS